MTRLILVHQPTKQALADYHGIAARMARLAPEIAVDIVDTKQTDWAGAKAAAASPLLTVSPMPIKKFSPPRGAIAQGYEWPKGEQYERLQAAGLPVPKWTRITPQTRLSAHEWGPYVVVKPELGRKGAEIRIKRTEKVRYKERAAFPANHPGSKGHMLAQEFIYTGRWAANYRVVTLFGRTLMCWLCEADHALPPLTGRYEFAGGGVTIVSNKKTSRYSLAYDRDVIALGERAHAAFADQPVLGSDIIRDAETGKLWLLECNPRGDTWYMSSATGRLIQAANGVELMHQFNALDVAADVLVETTRERAR